MRIKSTDTRTLVCTEIESAAIPSPAAIAPKPHIIFDGYHVYFVNPKAPPALIAAITATLLCRGSRSSNLNANMATKIEEIPITPANCPSIPLDHEREFIIQTTQIIVRTAETTGMETEPTEMLIFPKFTRPLKGMLTVLTTRPDKITGSTQRNNSSKRKSGFSSTLNSDVGWVF